MGEELDLADDLTGASTSGKGSAWRIRFAVQKSLMRSALAADPTTVWEVIPGVDPAAVGAAMSPVATTNPTIASRMMCFEGMAPSPVFIALPTISLYGQHRLTKARTHR